MLSRPAAALALAGLCFAPAAAQAGALERWRPEYRFERQERSQPVPVAGHGRPVVYGRDVRDSGERWLQYWTYYAYNSQDRGILKTGRHEGDWEVVQIRLGTHGRPVRAVFAQHSWAEDCALRRRRPTVYVANGSHAAYFTRGVHNRPWPDPDDEARGDGSIRRPDVVRITRTSPPWMRRRAPWGHSRAGWFPGEQSSPRGPRFQPARFDHPAAWAATARACGSGAPTRPGVTAAALIVALAALVSASSWMLRRSRLSS